MTNKQSDKRGIALIVVLGMLALLVMVGVAFSVFMRTERHAAGSFQHDVRGRLLLQAAEAHALEALDINLASKMYPDWTVLFSQNGSSSNILSTNQPWSAFIPESLLKSPEMSAALNGVCWISVPNGKVGYLIVNASGLVDVNSAGGLPRGSGLNPKEINIASLSEVTDAAKLVSKRPYESVAEMKRAAGGIGLSEVKNLVTFSMATTNVAPVPVDMSGDVASLNANKAAIKDALNAMAGGSGMDAEMAFNAMIDYADADSVPQNLDSPCTERVPMINEVRCSPNVIGLPVVGFMLGFDFQVELFYPFLNANPDNYTLKYKYTISPLSPAGFPTPAMVESSVALNNFLDQPFSTLGISPGLTPVPPAFAGTTAKFSIAIEYINLVDSKGNIVDSVRNLSWLVGPLFSAELPVPAVFPCAKVNGKPSGAECIDPRYNYLNNLWKPYLFVASDTTIPAAANGSMGLMNAETTFWLSKSETDGFPWMHVADQPFQSPGEWSYIIRGGGDQAAAWKTFRLLAETGGNADPIYTYFTVNSDPSTKKGFVNPNTEVPEVMDAVFKNMKLDAYPHNPKYADDLKAIDIDGAKAGQLTDAWMMDASITNSPVGGYSTRSEMINNATYIAAVSNLVDSTGVGKEFRKEAGIRNLLGLLHPRQNYFIIALFAQSASRVQLPVDPLTGIRKEIDTVRSDQSAILELWRDPVGQIASVGGVVTTNHPMFRRRYEVLSLE